MPSNKENFEEKKKGIKGGILETKKDIVEGISGTKKDIVEGISGKKKAIQGEIADTKQKISASIDYGKKTVTSFIKKLFLMIGVLALLAGIGYYIFANMTYSDGSRAGQLVKVTEKGVAFKTYEGELSLGGVSVEDGETNIGSIWGFSVVDEAVFQKLETLRGQKVVIQYEEKYRTLPWRGDTKYIVSGVDLVK